MVTTNVTEAIAAQYDLLGAKTSAGEGRLSLRMPATTVRPMVRSSCFRHGDGLETMARRLLARMDDGTWSER
jgi:hypothetical protein